VLGPEDRHALLAPARAAAAAAVRGEEPPILRNPDGALREKGAVFVTLRVGGILRGCIGHVEADAPLWETCRDMAEAADVVVGRALKSCSRTVLFLPQVSVEWGWDRDEYLRRIHEKAGIPAGDPDARPFAFTAEHFQG
jgi:hypothetical protein